jgi:hypothetical protein
MTNGKEVCDRLFKCIAYNKCVSDITRHNFEVNVRAQLERLFASNPHPSKDEIQNCVEEVLFGMCMEEVVYFRATTFD